MPRRPPSRIRFAIRAERVLERRTIVAGARRFEQVAPGEQLDVDSGQAPRHESPWWSERLRGAGSKSRVRVARPEDARTVRDARSATRASHQPPTSQPSLQQPSALATIIHTHKPHPDSPDHMQAHHLPTAAHGAPAAVPRPSGPVFQCERSPHDPRANVVAHMPGSACVPPPRSSPARRAPSASPPAARAGLPKLPAPPAAVTVRSTSRRPRPLASSPPRARRQRHRRDARRRGTTAIATIAPAR